MQWFRQILFQAIFVLVLAGIVVFAAKAPHNPAPMAGRRGGAGASVPNVLAVAAKLADVPLYIDGVGAVKALNSVVVRPQVDGRLLKIAFQEGQDVKRGDVLALIDPTTYQAQLDQSVAKQGQDMAQLANAKRDLERYVRLAQTNAGTTQQADTQRTTVAQLEAQLQSDQAAIDNSRAILAYTRIVAPFDGRTGLRSVDEGNLVRASDVTGIVSITQMQPIGVIFNVPQQQLARINAALALGPVEVTALATDGSSQIDTGVLKVVDNQVDQTTGTVKLKAEMPNPALQLWPGAFVSVRLLASTLRQVVVVPSSAVQRGPNGVFVYVVSNDTVSVRSVALTLQDDMQTIVASGLASGERVVTTGFGQLSDGAKVVVAAPIKPGLAPEAAITPPTARRGGGQGARGSNGTAAKPATGPPT